MYSVHTCISYFLWPRLRNHGRRVGRKSAKLEAGRTGARVTSGRDKTTAFMSSKQLCVPAKDEDSNVSALSRRRLRSPHLIAEELLTVAGWLLWVRESIFFKGVNSSRLSMPLSG